MDFCIERKSILVDSEVFEQEAQPRSHGLSIMLCINFIHMDEIDAIRNSMGTLYLTDIITTGIAEG